MKSGEKMENSQTCKLNNNTLKQPMDQKKKSKGNLEKHLETNENGNTTYQNVWDIPRVTLRGNFILIKAYIKKQERPQISNLTL